MLRKCFALGLSTTILYLASSAPVTLAQTLRGPGAEKVRADVQRLGTGPNARVEVKLKDNTKLKGYVSAVEDDSLTVADANTGASQTVAFTEVVSVKKPGHGLSTKSLLIIGGAAAGAIITFVAVKPALCDGGAQTRFPC